MWSSEVSVGQRGVVGVGHGVYLQFLGLQEDVCSDREKNTIEQYCSV